MHCYHSVRLEFCEYEAVATQSHITSVSYKHFQLCVMRLARSVP